MVCASWQVGFLAPLGCTCRWGRILPAHSRKDLLRAVHQDHQEFHCCGLCEQQALDSAEFGYFRSCGKTHRPGPRRGGFCTRRIPPSLICLLGWGQGLCEGGVCSDRLWALPPVPRQIYFEAKLHTSSRLLSGSHLLCPRANSHQNLKKKDHLYCSFISVFLNRHLGLGCNSCMWPWVRCPVPINCM